MEYHVEVLGGSMRGAKPEALESLLNQAARDDWVLGALSYKPNSNQLWVILQRGGESETPRPRRKSWLKDWS